MISVMTYVQYELCVSGYIGAGSSAQFIDITR
jgi:hypothetical protein